MSVKVGSVCYFWCHAYLRIIGRVVAIHGSRRVALDCASIIHGDEGYEQLMRRGVESGATNYSYIGGVPDVAYLAAFDFPHPLPTKGKGQ